MLRKHIMSVKIGAAQQLYYGMALSSLSLSYVYRQNGFHAIILVDRSFCFFNTRILDTELRLLTWIIVAQKRSLMV